MKKIHFLIIFYLNIAVLQAQDTFQLAQPILKYPSVFFTKEAKIEMKFAEPNTQIHFTTNNQDPTEKDPIYTTPITISKSFTTVKARVFSKIYKPSDVVQATFIKAGLPIKSIDCTTPNPKYAGSGPTTLMDNIGGTSSISGKTWLGFQVDTVEIIVNLTKKEKVKKVLVNLLQDFGSWIFLPEKVDAFYFDTAKNGFLPFGNLVFDQEKEAPSNLCTPSVLEVKKGIKTDKIKIQLHLLKQISVWHAGKGNKSWIFVDEIKVY